MAPGVSVALQKPSSHRVHLSYSIADIAAHSMRIKAIPPADR